ncbi:MAG: segregation/condensation protein A [Deltaproteobacteria bacterium]|nr:MAG: segregation/condensation protein A [Deltaproteobacteria bacterium]
MDTISVHLDNFTGPLDLLLHLIRKNEVEITDIPIAEITAQYLAVIDAMQTLNLDVAGEFLLMAATLLHIKSRMLLPQIVEDGGEEEEEDDPRAELVRRLLEYQKYRDAAVRLDDLPQLNRDLYARSAPAPEVVEEGEGEFAAVGLYDLLQALQQLLKERPAPLVHEVSAEQLSVSDRINQILAALHGQQSLAFTELFTAQVSRHEVVVTFLAMLELVRLKLVRLLQSQRFGAIWLTPAVADAAGVDTGFDEEASGYV